MIQNSGGQNKAMIFNAKARFVLILLGFSGFSKFSRFSGCDDRTVTDLLCRQRRHRKNFVVAARIYEALVNRYREREKFLQKIDRIYLKTWINGWIKNITKNIDDFIWVKSHVRHESPRATRQRELRMKKRYQNCTKLFELLK